MQDRTAYMIGFGQCTFRLCSGGHHIWLILPSRTPCHLSLIICGAAGEYGHLRLDLPICEPLRWEYGETTD